MKQNAEIMRRLDIPRFLKLTSILFYYQLIHLFQSGCVEI